MFGFRGANHDRVYLGVPSGLCFFILADTSRTADYK
jgi:hypothetical protein